MSQNLNIARNALRRGYAGEMVRKLWLRCWDRHVREADQSRQWCRQHETDADAWARSIDARLWAEADAFSRVQGERAAAKSNELGFTVGGAGFHQLLYFLARLLRPNIVVETGVAFGFSSRAFLTALAENRSGKLYSSDFPYFRLYQPERIIGCLVEPELRDRWELLIGSDRRNLKRITAAVERINLFHFDSDKSYSGRELALRVLGPKLANDALILFDDIQDNLHFRDLVRRPNRAFLVFGFGGKWIGLTGGPGRLFHGSREANRTK